MTGQPGLGSSSKETRPSSNSANHFASVTPTKQSNAQHLVEYKKQLLQEENKKSRNGMQQPMHSYVCGINLRSESSLVLSDLLFT